MTSPSSPLPERQGPGMGRPWQHDPAKDPSPANAATHPPTPPGKRGWCPTLDHPMPSGDGLLARLNPPRATLTPDQADGLADAIDRHANGIIELTQRGNLQVRGLTDTPAFAAAARALGLALPPEQEARRPILPPPLLGADPTLHPGTEALLARLEHAAQHDPRLAALPGKFTVALEAGGLFANQPIAADLLAHPDGRLTQARKGATPAPVGPHPYPGLATAAFGLAPPFAQLDTAMLRTLAALARAHATTLRLTPGRAILLAAIPQGTEIHAPAFITDPADLRLNVTACIGAPGCRSGQAPTRTFAATLRPSTHLHVSGCTKGCAHPGPAPITLVGVPGPAGATGNAGRYDLVRNGRANGPPIATALDAPASQSAIQALAS